MKCRAALFLLLIAATAVPLTAKSKLLTFGAWMKVPFFLGPHEDKTMEIKIRPLMVDGKIKEFTTGDIHEVTDQLFVVRRAYRVNDFLPDDPEPKKHRWKWQRAGWLLVDRSAARISQINLPEFDPFYSTASWFRDYIAYCGLNNEATQVYAIVAQIGQKKPLLKQKLAEAKNGETPESECATPHWDRNPIRVTFEPRGGQKQTFQVFGRAADALPVASGDDE
jgi:hypothetical protein